MLTWNTMIDALERQAPWWEPGSAHGYHVNSFGFLVGELVRRVGDGAVIVFTSVHGDMHGAHGLFRKGWPQEESVRVPLLVRVPGVEAKTDEAAVSLVDLRAMTLGWADGSALGTTRSTFSRISMPSVVARPHQCDRTWRGVRSRERKLVLNADGSPWLFFDLASDPLELKNLAEDPARAEEIKRLAQLMA